MDYLLRVRIESSPVWWGASMALVFSWGWVSSSLSEFLQLPVLVKPCICFWNICAQYTTKSEPSLLLNPIPHFLPTHLGVLDLGWWAGSRMCLIIKPALILVFPIHTVYRENLLFSPPGIEHQTDIGSEVGSLWHIYKHPWVCASLWSHVFNSEWEFYSCGVWFQEELACILTHIFAISRQ